ncbi:hypothetical protein WN943_023533 [Citrus x changshan-huyou]
MAPLRFIAEPQSSSAIKPSMLQVFLQGRHRSYWAATRCPRSKVITEKDCSKYVDLLGFAGKVPQLMILMACCCQTVG